jgi:hypothetical protein
MYNLIPDIMVVFDGVNGMGQSKFMVNERGHTLSVAHNVIACFQYILEICMTNQNFIEDFLPHFVC